MKAWDEILRIQGQIRKKRKMEMEYARKQREDVINALIVGVGVLFGGGLLIYGITFYI